MKSTNAPYSVKAVNAGQPDTQMLENIRRHDASLATLLEQKRLHPNVTLIDDMINAFHQSRETAVRLLTLPQRVKDAVTRTAVETTSRA